MNIIPILNDLLFVAVVILMLMPAICIPATVFIGRVYFSAANTPRNKILYRMLASGVSTSLASLMVSVLAVRYIMQFIHGETHDINLLIVFLVLALIIVEVQPFFNWQAFRSFQPRGETATQEEDRHFGDIRRLEEEENKIK